MRRNLTYSTWLKRDYPITAPFVPHGIRVIVNAPSVFEYTASAIPERHLEGADFLDADTTGASADDTGEVISKRLIQLMKDTHMPNGLSELNFTQDDITPMVESSFRQQRANKNAPSESNLVDIENMHQSTMSYW